MPVSHGFPLSSWSAFFVLGFDLDTIILTQEKQQVYTVLYARIDFDKYLNKNIRELVKYVNEVEDE